MNKIQELLDDEQFFMQSTMTILKLNIYKYVNGKTDNDKQYICSIFNALSDSFKNIKTEHLHFKKLDDIGVLVKPIKNIIRHKLDDKLLHGKIILESIEVQTYSVPLPIILKKNI